MIRLIAIDAMRKQANDEDLKILRDFQSGEVNFDDARNAIRRLREKYPDQRDLLYSIEDAFYCKELLTPDQENQLFRARKQLPIYRSAEGLL